ncbi:hypothetical protein RQP46_001181 [Phenoliferia psychrophenolica]
MAAKKKSSSSSVPASPKVSSSSTAPSTTASRSHLARNVPVQIFRPPKPLTFFQRSWVWYESSFAISMLEPWEKILLHTFALALLFLFYFAVSTYLPAQLKRISGRVMFYLYGE